MREIVENTPKKGLDALRLVYKVIAAGQEKGVAAATPFEGIFDLRI
ncbi:MAG: hypothetical protein IJ344_02630 [Clostridia bacterium]|nr:hypothetical protein [Clostridia bacterium]